MAPGDVSGEARRLLVQAAQAFAEAEEIEGRARGAVEQARREAITAAVEREGQAEASAVLAKGQAEAQAMDRKAEAFRNYDEAAILDLVVRVLPELVKGERSLEIAVPSWGEVENEWAKLLGGPAAMQEVREAMFAFIEKYGDWHRGEQPRLRPVW